MSEPESRLANVRLTQRSVLKLGTVGLAAFLARLLKPSPASAKPQQCYLNGTRILTSNGYREVENLAIGDMLPTASGALKPVLWIGRYPYKKSDGANAWVKDALPVRIARSALADNVPHADLYLSSGHAVFIDDCLVPVGSLVNGVTIMREDCRDLDLIEYFHIKVPGHDVIYAEGALCETLWMVSEAAANFAEYLRLYGQQADGAGHYAPLLAYDGGWSESRSRWRSAVSPWIDRRQKLDIIRDRLEDRAARMKMDP